MKRRIAVLLLCAATASSAAKAAAPPAPPTATPAPGKAGARAPFDSPPVAPDTITIALDLRAARAILALLGQAKFEPAEAKLLEGLPAVKFAIRDSNRPPETFERDLSAAFDDQTRFTLFDFRRIREEHRRWKSFGDDFDARIRGHARGCHRTGPSCRRSRPSP
jgi:hypothetical protein